MDGLRGYAVLLVFLVHHHTLFGGFLAQSSPFFELSQYGHDIGHSGVDLFFVLSGFLIYGHLFQRAPKYFSYLEKRARRIYPTFLFVFAVYLIASYWLPSVSKMPHSHAAALLYVFENLIFLPGIFPIEPVITVSWSISYEFLFYLSIPLLISLTGMRQWRRRSRVLLFLGIVATHCIACSIWNVPHIRMDLFLAGMLLYEASESGQMDKWLSKRGEFLAIGAYCTALMTLSLFELSSTGIAFHPHFPNRSFPSWTLLLMVGLFGLTTYTVYFNGILRPIFNLKPLRWLGNMSYSYFLCHGIALNAIAFALRTFRKPQSPLFFLALLCLNLVTTVAVSFLVFLLIEKRFSLAVRGNRSPQGSVVEANSATSPPPTAASPAAAERLPETLRLRPELESGTRT